MKLEHKFIKQLEAYFFKEFSDFDKKRILFFLEEYKKDLKLVVREKEVIREIKIYEKVETLPPEVPLQQYRLAATPSVILDEAKKFCEKHNIPLQLFRIKTKKTEQSIAMLRKEFCAMIVDRFMVKNISLASFFGIHYATINYYLYGSKYTPKTNRPSNTKIRRRIKIKTPICTD